MESPGLDRLGEAMAVWLRHRRDATTPESVLGEHPELRDLLGPLLQHDDPGAGSPTSPPTSAPATVLGDFRLLREIGRGGMGVVWEATQISLDRRVAIKVLAPGTELQPRALARFRREAATAAGLDHPGIVDVIAVGEQDGRHWFAMELVAGQRLDHHARELRSRCAAGYAVAVADLVAKVADALHCAHAAGVVHRDVKPGNILVRADGSPVVTDFGLCRTAARPALSQSGDFAGTPHYMSPEQARGDAEIGPGSDVFALGVTLYELLTQQLPFDGDSTRAVLDKILTSEPPHPQRLVPDLPRDLTAIVMKALAKERSERYATAAAFAADLRRYGAGVPVLARPAPPARRLWRWIRREPLRSAFAGIGVVTFVLFGYLLIARPALLRGRQELAAARVERLVLDATLARFVHPPQDARAMLGEALQLAADDPYLLVSLAMSEGYSERPRGDGGEPPLATVAQLQPWNAHAAVRRALAFLRQRQGDPAAAAELAAMPAPADSLDHYVAGEIAIRRAVRGDAGAGGEALEHLRRAVALAERPRAEYFIALNRAARVAGDREAILTAADALVRHWPDRAVAHCHRALAYVDVDPAVAEAAARRSLDLSPDNFHGLHVLAVIAANGGDPKAAVLLGRLEQLYPQQVQFLRGGTGHGVPSAIRAGRTTHR
jgi:hypothetical protein